MTSPRALGLAAFALVASSYGCKAGVPANAVRAEAPTYVEATGASAETCDPVEGSGAPFLVDSTPEQRADLEVAMKQGVAVVTYDCHKLKVLDDCRVQGSYGFLGVETKEQLVRLESADEIKANLPLSGLKIAGNISGELARGTTLDVALVISGKKVGSRKDVLRTELTGKCDGATHFVRSLTVGAFAMQTGSKAKVRTVVEVFGAKADGASASSKDVTNTDGKIEACKSAAPDLLTPTPQCSSPVRLQLVAIQAESSKDKGAGPKVEMGGGDVCPKGFVLSGDKCTRPTAGKAYQCTYGDVPNCVKQCNGGDLYSCVILGAMHGRGDHAPKDPARALQLYTRACDGGSALGCNELGVALVKGDGAPGDPTKAAGFFQKGCGAGDEGACRNLGSLHWTGNGVPKDRAKAIALMNRACEGGYGVACADVGTQYSMGGEIEKNIAKGVLLLERGCELGTQSACNNLGLLYFYGNGVTKDASKGALLFNSSCDKGSGSACSALGFAYEIGQGAEKNIDKARELYEFACFMRESDDGCANLGVWDETHGGVPKSAARSYMKACHDDQKGCKLVDDYKRDCAGGEVRACTLAGALGRPVDKTAAMENLKKGCDGGDQAGCMLMAAKKKPAAAKK